MTTKVRKQIYVEPNQDLLLKQAAGDLGVSEAEIIRQAIDRHIQGLRQLRYDRRAWQVERAFIETLIDQEPVPGGRIWKRDDLYDR